MINNKLGYYAIDKCLYDSKILACIEGTKSNKDIKWIFNNDVFEKYNWTVEPDFTLDQLYDKRSRQLREMYDYIIISYSGGADSHNIVESFIRQGLHIDELIINTMEKGNSKFTILDPKIKNPENAASEHYLQTIPRLNEIKNRSPKTKITILDLTDHLFTHWLSNNDASWILNKKEGLNPLNVTRFNYLHFNEVRKKFDKDKKIAVILGIEKPRTFIHSNNKFYLRFTDRAANIVGIADYFKDYVNSTVEFFYWSPDSCDILCKQAHIIKRWLEKDPINYSIWFHKNMTKHMYRLVHERILRTLIYTTWDNTWFQCDKATKDWYSEFDSWFINNLSGTDHHNVWLEGIRYVEKYAAKFVNIDDNKADGLITFSYNYFIGQMNPSIDLKKIYNPVY